MCADSRPAFSEIVVTLESIEREREKSEAPIILGKYITDLRFVTHIWH